ncbi:MAG TPA: hypothetical protein VF170_15735 [Planctomycetaceae bacterium]
MIRIHVAESHSELRRAVVRALRGREGLKVVGVSDGGASGPTAVAGTQPDVVVTSAPFAEPPWDWLDGYRAVVPGVKIVLLCSTTPVAGGDAALDGSGGIAALLAAIRSPAD